MDILDALANRRSIRDYKDQAVSKEDLMACLDAARIAPSWKNTQCWRYIVLSDKELIEKLGEATGYNPRGNAYKNASYFIVQCADTKAAENWEDKQYFMMDMGISMQQLMLRATSLGLGTCWVGAFPEQPVKELLNIPDNISVTALTPLGVPEKEVAARPRKDMDEIAFLNEWQKPLD